MEKKNLYDLYDEKFKKRQTEFEDILFKLGSVDKIQRKRRLYEKVNKDLRERYCHSTKEASNILDEFIDAVSAKTPTKKNYKFEFKRTKPTRAILPGFELATKQTIIGNTSMENFWRIMSELTKIGPECFYCTNKASKCSQFGIFKQASELENFKSCPECKELLTKGIIPKLNYIEQFHLTSEHFLKMKELRLRMTLAVPISTTKH